MNDTIKYAIVAQFNLPNIIRQLALLLLRLLGIRVYTIRVHDHMIAILTKINIMASDQEDKTKSGYFIGKGFVGWTDHNMYSNNRVMFIVTTPVVYDALMKDVENLKDFVRRAKPPAIEKVVPKRIGMTRISARAELVVRRLNSYIEPTPCQFNMLRSIMDIYWKKEKACVFIHGPPRTGKTTMAALIAQYIEGVLVTTYSPTSCSKPSFEQHHMYCMDQVGYECMVVCMDEIDVALESLTKGLPPVAMGQRREVENKTEWNGLLDDFGRGIYERTIIIMTSNKSPEHIDSLDPSYIREGRVDACYEMTELISVGE